MYRPLILVIVALAACQWTKPIDEGTSGGVAPIRGFTVEDTSVGHQLRLSWTNSSTITAAYVRILRYAGGTCSDDSDPSTYDGKHDLEVSGVGEQQTFVDTGLTDGQVYCYAIFAKSNGLFSSPVKATATPSNTLPPSTVSNFSATPSSMTIAGLGVIELTWTSPADDDLARVVLMVKPGEYPSTMNDAAATVLFNGLSETHNHVGATDGVEYFYRIWACDEADNCSEPSQVTATRLLADDDGDGQTEAQGDCDDSNGQVFQGAQIQNCSAIDWASLISPFMNGPQSLSGVGFRYETQRRPTDASWTRISAQKVKGVSSKSGDS